jgi:outer membrane protein OmpA-like peptidoglycan-associated protein
MNKIITTILFVSMIAAALGCGMTNQQKGAVIGAGTGAAAGGAIGSQSGNTLEGAIIGAAVGGLAGAVIGDYMDDQAEEIQNDLDGATVERVGEGIKITFDSGILFDVDKSNLQPEGQVNLTNLAAILRKYDDTEILIEGHTDATGSENYNMTLSRNRAQSVATHLEGEDVAVPRFTIMGYGEVQPIGDNATAEGRAANRRVELAIMANEKLKGEAEKKVEEDN